MNQTTACITLTLRALIALVLGLVAVPAAAHVTLAETQAPADSYYKATLRVPHGCLGSPTVGLRVRIPEGVTGVTPQPKHGWTLKITKANLSPPVEDAHGRKITEAVSEVAWTGGALADEHFDEFQMMMKLPQRIGTLYFPVVQECAQGVQRWIEVPQEGQVPEALKLPAPAMKLTPRL